MKYSGFLMLQMAKLEVRLEELNDLQEEAIKTQDFTKAEFLKNDITSLREQISVLKDNFFCKPLSVCCESTDEANNFTVEEDEVIDFIHSRLERLTIGKTVFLCHPKLRY